MSLQERRRAGLPTRRTRPTLCSSRHQTTVAHGNTSAPDRNSPVFASGKRLHTPHVSAPAPSIWRCLAVFTRKTATRALAVAIFTFTVLWTVWMSERWGSIPAFERDLGIAAGVVLVAVAWRMWGRR